MRGSIAEQRAEEAGNDGTKFNDGTDAIFKARGDCHRFSMKGLLDIIYTYLDGSAIGVMGGFWDVLCPNYLCWVGERCQCGEES